MLFSRFVGDTLRRTTALSSRHLLHRRGIQFGNHLVSVRDNPLSFIVFLYSSKGADQHSYPNENLGDKNRDNLLISFLFISRGKRGERCWTHLAAYHLLAFSHPELPPLSIPIVAFWGVLDRDIVDKHGIENLQ
jgi:hypothetical protein